MSLQKTLTKSRLIIYSTFSITILILSISQNVFATFNQDVENALKFGQNDGKYGQIKFDLRYRYENASTKIPSRKSANADTVRLRLGYLTPKLFGLQVFAEYEGNQDIFNNNYNSGRNGKTSYDVIADPQQHELNQFWFTFTAIPDTEIKVGRQRIKIDNDRFIGNVGWRQMEQTYDAVMVTNKSLPNTTVKAGYILNTRDIFSRENDMDSQFVNIGYHIDRIGSITAYTYLIDFQESPAQNANSSQTYGVRFNGTFEMADGVKTHYTAEYAWQRDLAANPNRYEVDYFNVLGGITAHGMTLKASMEQLGGRGKGFTTPLATLHAFQGWADIFLATPVKGIRDISVSLSTNVKGIKLMGVYHDFDDDTGNNDYGKEYDFVVVKKFGKHYSLLAKYAFYDADNFATDTQKFWLQGGISF